MTLSAPNGEHPVTVKETDNRLKVYYFYSYGTAAWMSIQSLPLIASPTMIVTLLSPEVREPSSKEQNNEHPQRP
jgi:hypothetical protein